ncbi:hypothetical protein DMH04_16240 [Kibdelosporangium aridum]|uniref:Uncharacterized protein n=1 Tax=Kibdelosporangium aridum TaxID=2030 RepID=A0A428ZCD2_KIBAR|nr:hypothetical protein [Kibdelosporangium aridum]RSM85747.1 hypothetical protein DMH04_16240 [Kibdelosporangium aridum]
MRRHSLLSQIMAVISRRTPAFRPSPGQPKTFSGALNRVLRPHRVAAPSTDSGSADNSDQRATASGLTVPADPQEPIGPVIEVDEGTQVLALLAELFATQPAHERLAARAWLESPTMALVRQLLDIHSKATTVHRNLTSGLAGGRTRALVVGDIVHNIARIRSVAEDIVNDYIRAIVVKDKAADRSPTYPLTRAEEVARILGGALARSSGSDGRARRVSLARTLTRYLEDALSAASKMITIPIHTHDPSLARKIVATIHKDLRNLTEAKSNTVAETLTHLRSAAGDMVDADLLTTDLTGIPLDGVRWSTGTRWPRATHEWVVTHSERIGPDLFEVVQDRYNSDDSTATLAG